MKLLREREQKRVELATQIADVRLEDYKINFPLRGGGEKKKEEKRRYGEERRTEREREKEEKEGEKGSAVSCDAAVITTS